MAYFELGWLYRCLPAVGEGNDRKSQPILILRFRFNFQQDRQRTCDVTSRLFRATIVVV
jgi:hypothetical protein